MDDPFQILFFIIHLPYHATVYIFFRGRDAQDVGHEF
jgi:hypothetical protein